MALTNTIKDTTFGVGDRVRVVQKLKDGEDQAELAKKLATIVTDTPVVLDLEKCAISCFDINELKKSFEELGFKSLVKRLEPNSSENKKHAATHPQTPEASASGGQAEAQKGNETQKKKKEGEQLGLL